MEIEQGFKRVKNSRILVPTDREAEQFLARLKILTLQNLLLTLNLLFKGALFCELVF